MCRALSLAHFLASLASVAASIETENKPTFTRGKARDRGKLRDSLLCPEGEKKERADVMGFITAL